VAAYITIEIDAWLSGAGEWDGMFSLVEPGGEELLMLDVSQVDRRTGQDWPYTEEQMEEKSALQHSAQRDYPASGRRVAGQQAA
jgi:hypothetical protein